jgi:hypothetical protein
MSDTIMNEPTVRSPGNQPLELGGENESIGALNSINVETESILLSPEIHSNQASSQFIDLTQNNTSPPSNSVALNSCSENFTSSYKTERDTTPPLSTHDYSASVHTVISPKSHEATDVGVVQKLPTLGDSDRNIGLDHPQPALQDDTTHGTPLVGIPSQIIDLEEGNQIFAPFGEQNIEAEEVSPLLWKPIRDG